MRAERVKQVLKNGVYRTIGETATAIGADANGDRSLRVLMYHKVNDVPENPLSMPVSVFDEQMDLLRVLGYTVIDLQAVLDYYVEGRPLPPKAVLITFDDGYHDNLDNAARVLRTYGYPAVLFVPVGYLDDRQPLPHEERLGRPVRAFSYVKGSEADYRPVHLSLVRQAGYDVAFSAVSGANSAATDPLQLRRYNIEPYPARTFELVLSGACDLISLKDTVTGTHARRLFNAALATSTR